MRVYYDFHMHSALSPCANDDMTPNNIVNMAALKGLDAIAITDHNSLRNAEAVLRAAKNNGLPLTVLPGVEVETAEEAHVLCLFADMESALAFAGFLDSVMPPIANREDIFGRQLIIDENDEQTGTYTGLLLNAAQAGIAQIFREVRAMGGVAIPAHVDRDSHSVLSNLGFIPEELDVGLVEISARTDAAAFMAEHAVLMPGVRAFVVSSDAHRLEDISERERFIEVEGDVTPRNLIDALRNL